MNNVRLYKIIKKKEGVPLNITKVVDICEKYNIMINTCHNPFTIDKYCEFTDMHKCQVYFRAYYDFVSYNNIVFTDIKIVDNMIMRALIKQGWM